MNHICCIAAHDTSNGAGITRDCIVAHDFGIIAHPAITALTTQSFEHVENIWPIKSTQIKDQLNSIDKNFKLSAIKIGMLYAPEIVEVVAEFIVNHQNIPIILDPVIKASGGQVLVTSKAIELIIKKIIPYSKIVTPNKYELEIITKRKIENLNDALIAASEFAKNHNCMVLLKGGHFDGITLYDFIISKNEKIEVSHERRNYTYSHGSGCVISTALTCSLSLGNSISQALNDAVDYTLKYFDKMNVAFMQ